MSEREAPKPLLMDELSTGEKVLLANLSLHPGFQVLIKLFDAACTSATNDVIKLDPLVEEYDRKLAYLQQAARTVNKFTNLVRKSIIYHSAMGEAETAAIESDLEARVNQAEREIAAGS